MLGSSILMLHAVLEESFQYKDPYFTLELAVSPKATDGTVYFWSN